MAAKDKAISGEKWIAVVDFFGRGAIANLPLALEDPGSGAPTLRLPPQNRVPY